MRVFLIVVLILSATAVASAQVTFYYPHVVDGVQGSVIWKTTILLTNPTAGTASGTITFTQDSSSQGSSHLTSAGSPFTISLTNQNNITTTGSTFPFSIPANGTLRLVSSGGAQFGSGFATVSTDTGMVGGTAIFSEFDSSGNLIGEAGVPSASAVLRQAIFVDTINNYKIGVAYANPGTNSANITLTLLYSNAVKVVPRSVSQVLGPGNHTAAFTFQMFPDAPNDGDVQMAGTMQLASDSPLAAIALRFDPTLSKFTTLPPVSLASLINPALEWLQQREWLTPLSSVARLLGAFQLRIG